MRASKQGWTETNYFSDRGGQKDDRSAQELMVVLEEIEAVVQQKIEQAKRRLQDGGSNEIRS